MNIRNTKPITPKMWSRIFHAMRTAKKYKMKVRLDAALEMDLPHEYTKEELMVIMPKIGDKWCEKTVTGVEITIA